MTTSMRFRALFPLVRLTLVIAAGAVAFGAPAWAQVPSSAGSNGPGEDQLWGAKRIFAFPSLPSAAQPVSVESRQEITIAGDRVTIVRDSWGVPHIFGATDHALFAAQGYVQAQDRLWQMEMWRRFSRGELAEIDGEASLESDVGMRSAGLTDAELERNFERLSPWVRSIYQAFTEGVNQYIGEARRDGRLPAAFASYGITPRPWTTSDSVANMAMFHKRIFWSGKNAQMKQLDFFRLARSRASSDRDAMRTMNDISWVNDPAALTTKTGPAAAPRALPADPPSNLRAVLAIAPGLNSRELARVAQPETMLAAAQKFFLPTDAGSYLWLISPRHSVTGAPILLSGPECGFSSPQITHEIHLSGNGFDIAGGGLVGIPGLMVGTNGHLTWGFTYGQAHLDDTFVEKLNPANAHEYFYKGRYRPMERRVERFVVKGREVPVEKEFFRTVHGPVIAWDRQRNAAIALGAPFFKDEYGTLQAWADLLHARTIKDAASAALQMSHGNNIYAVTRTGDIGWWYAGRYPTYAPGVDNRFPMPGTGESDWTGVVPPDKLPQTINPPDGYILNWNNKPSPDWDCAEGALYGWGKTHRIENLRDLFQKRLAAAGGKMSITDMLAITYEVGLMGDGSPRALIPFLTAALSAPGQKLSADARQAAAFLTGWDRRTSDWSVGATLFGAWVSELKQALFPFTGRKEEAALWNQFVNTTTVLHALEGPKSSVPLSRSYTGGRAVSAVVVDALENAVKKLKAQRQDGINFWGARLGWIDLRPLPPIPGFRRGTYLFAAEMTPETLMYTVVVPGNSGDPASPHFADQRELGSWYMFKRLACSRRQVPGTE